MQLSMINKTNKSGSIPNKSIILLVFFVFLCSLFFYASHNYSIVVFFAILFFIIVGYLTLRDINYSFIVILFLSLDTFGLLPSIDFLGGVFSWGDLGIIWLLFLFFLMIIKRVHYKFDKIGVVLFIYVSFLIWGSLLGKLIYNQDFFVGLLVFRKSYLIFAYFPIAAFYTNGLITKKHIINTLIFMIKIYTIIVFIELMLLYMNVGLTNYKYTWRWGFRLYAPNEPQMIGLFYTLYLMIKGKKNLRNLIWLIIFSLGVILINQSRVMIVGTIIACFIVAFIFGKNKTRIFSILILSIGSLAILVTPSIRSIIVSSINEFSDEATSGTMYYREYERLYFETMLQGHEIFGVGIPNMNSGIAAQYSGKNIEGYFFGHYMSGAYISDLGIYAIRYYFGYFGITFFVIILGLSAFKLISKYWKGERNVFLFISSGILIYQLFVANTMFVFFETSFLYLTLLILAKLISDKSVMEKDY